MLRIPLPAAAFSTPDLGVQQAGTFEIVDRLQQPMVVKPNHLFQRRVPSPAANPNAGDAACSPTARSPALRVGVRFALLNLCARQRLRHSRTGANDGSIRASSVLP